MHTYEQIRQFIDGQGLVVDPSNWAERGHLVATDGAKADYGVIVDRNLKLARMCEVHWGSYNQRLLNFIRRAIENGADKDELLSRTQFGDAHWEWLKKALVLQDERYRWFFVLAEDQPQAACVIYQPKPSIIKPESNIFYVDYLAVAPWNRNNPMESRRFSGLGSLTIAAACRYAIQTLKLRPGFSLHSLPGAVEFYKKLGMQNFPAHNKEGLEFFEVIDDLNELGVHA